MAVRPDPEVSNCLVFALRRWRERGGYLVVRRSRHGWWPHLIWCSDLRDAEIEHFVPNRYAGRLAFVHKIFFRGRVKRTDRD